MSFIVHNLEKVYGERKVLAIGTLTFRGAAVTALMGPNGAGKTTLLKILAGLEHPTAGEVIYRGQPVTPGMVPRLRQEVSLVHQSPLLFDTTVFENVSFGLKVRRIPKADLEKRVAEALAMMGLSRLEGDRRARGLSGGEVQRVAIARALALEPAVLLLDEPFANVDQATLRALEDLFHRMGEGGRTLIFSTHDSRLAHRVAQEVVVLQQGRLSSSPYENLYTGRVLTDGGTAWFDTGRIRIAVPAGFPQAGPISIRPDEILLSREPLKSSARNVFQGRLTRIEEQGEGVLDVTVEAGEPFIVRVTRESFAELKLTVGAQVYITFKSTAVKAL